MAVFGPKDKDVPFLTQVYQLDIPEPALSAFKYPFYHSDIDKWMGQLSHNGKREPLEYWSDDCWPMAPPEDGTRWSVYPDLPALSSPEAALLDPSQRHELELQWERHKKNRLFNINSTIESCFGHLFPVIDLTKRIMTSVCDDNRISEVDAEHLFEQSKLWRPYPNFDWDKDDDGYIRLANLRLTDISPSINDMEWRVLKALKEALTKAQRVPGYFQRCQQCNSVFLVERKGTIYCSRRCNFRSQMQKLRDRKKSELLTGG